MAFDAFLEVAGIKGESTDKAHKDWIEIENYAYGVSMTGSGIGTAGGHSKGRADFTDFSVTKKIDLASPTLAIACAKGDPLGTIKMSACRAGGDKLEFMKVEMTDAMITNVSHGGGGDFPMETITFAYATIKWTYTQQDEKGAAKGDASAGWNLLENAKMS